ncbi:unnamed protein product [Trichogramma brassicae]|uniref:Uncharacterized protein n=1 Tax=Trichogramma brassicae TaxID=86971 RepID=A0A6H5IMR0_9HYME|nr:unnamed protein product [Trichogramma brassicae]
MNSSIDSTTIRGLRGSPGDRPNCEESLVPLLLLLHLYNSAAAPTHAARGRAYTSAPRGSLLLAVAAVAVAAVWRITTTTTATASTRIHNTIQASLHYILQIRKSIARLRLSRRSCLRTCGAYIRVRVSYSLRALITYTHHRSQRSCLLFFFILSGDRYGRPRDWCTYVSHISRVAFAANIERNSAQVTFQRVERQKKMGKCFLRDTHGAVVKNKSANTV